MDETELDAALEASMVEKIQLSDSKARLIQLKDDPNTTAERKAGYKAELILVQNKIEGKQNEIDLIRAVSSEKIRATTTTST